MIRHIKADYSENNPKNKESITSYFLFSMKN